MRTNSEIQQNVMEELKWEPLLNASEIGVAVKNGVVTLSGIVDTYAKKVAAEKAAKRVAGVKAVAEDITVRLFPGTKKTDAEIAEAVLTALQWHSAVQEDQIKVKVEDGIVTLEGEVQWQFQKDAARNMVENLNGVREISNKIKITPAVTSKNIKHEINAAFHRHATVDSGKIKVEVSGSRVTLRGKVRSWAEKRDAEIAAWLAPGVNTIDNELEITEEIFAY